MVHFSKLLYQYLKINTSIIIMKTIVLSVIAMTIMFICKSQKNQNSRHIIFENNLINYVL